MERSGHAQKYVQMSLEWHKGGGALWAVCAAKVEWVSPTGTKLPRDFRKSESLSLKVTWEEIFVEGFPY